MNSKLIVFFVAVIAIAIGVFSIFSIQSPILNSEDNRNGTENFPQNLTSNNKDFAFGLYSEVAQQNPKMNIFYSPLGIDMAFSLAYEGADGDTATQMQQVFNFETNDQKRGEMMVNLMESLKSEEDYYKLEIANALWVEDGYQIKEDYLHAAKTFYNSTVDNVDFATDDGVNKINLWVEEKTHDKIQDILPLGSTDESTRMVITNAVYFKGKWSQQFNPQQTTQGLFWLDKENTVEVKMMKQPADFFNYAETNELQALEMNYLGGDISMLILLPKDRDGIESLEKSLDMQKLLSINSMLKRQPLSVQIPKFEFETEYGLVELLKDLGIKDAFDKYRANFAGITAGEQLYIDKAKHKAFVNVDEQGTEAAAITALVMRPTSGPPTPQLEFIADHPFVFVIQEKGTGEILFIGRLANP